MAIKTYKETLKIIDEIYAKAWGKYGQHRIDAATHWCAEAGHEVVENGAQRSWCKHCNIDMIFEWTLGKYEPKSLEEKGE